MTPSTTLPTTLPTVPPLDRDPVRLARTAGALFVVLAVLGPFALLYVPDRVVVAGDAAATAGNLRASAGLVRAGIAAEVVIALVEIVVVVLLYLLLRPVSRWGSLAAALARFTEAVVIGVGALASLLALRLAGAGDAEGFTAGQRDALALLALRTHGDAVLVGQLFFGVSLGVLGWLVARSGFLPRLFGPLLVVAAAGYLADGLGGLLWSGYAETAGWVVGVTAVVGEVPFFLWLLVKGVDARAWGTRAAMGAGAATAPAGHRAAVR